MFGNNYLEEFQNASMQLEDAKRFWTEAIITMDPFARKLILSQYDGFIIVLVEEIQNYKNQLEPRMGLPLKLPPDLQKKANTLEAISSAVKIIRQAIRDEDNEGENYLNGLPISYDLNSLYKKRSDQLREDFPFIPTIGFEDEDEDEDLLSSREKKKSNNDKELVEKQSNSWDSFYSEFEGEFNEKETLGIELIDSEEVRNKLQKLGYKENTSDELDHKIIGEYFPTISDESEESVIIIFHKLPLDFDFDEGNDLVKKWFGLYKKDIRSLDPYQTLEENEEDQNLEKLQSLKEFAQNRFKGEAKQWLKQLVENTKKRTSGHYKDRPSEFSWNPEEVEDWEYECAAALTASSIDEYNAEGKEAATKTLAEYFSNTTLIGEEQSTKIHFLLLHSSMIGFENYFLNDCKLGGNESIKLTDEIVLEAFNIDLNNRHS